MHQRFVEILAAELGVAEAGLDVENAFHHFEDGDVERAAAEVEHDDLLLGIDVLDAERESGCRRLAIMAQDGLAQAIRPAHTPFDGDTVFALSTGENGEVDPALLARLGSAAASCLARAIMRAVTEAAPLGGLPSWRQLWATG